MDGVPLNSATAHLTLPSAPTHGTLVPVSFEPGGVNVLVIATVSAQIMSRSFNFCGTSSETRSNPLEYVFELHFGLHIPPLAFCGLDLVVDYYELRQCFAHR